jgi:hypothetical protein
MRTKRLRQSLIALALLAGCGDGGSGGGSRPLRPVPGCERIDHRPCDVRDAACQTRLFALAGCLRGEDPGSLPPIAVMSEADFAALLTSQAAMRTPSPHRATWDWALSALELIQPGDLGTDAMIAQSVKFLWGIYRFDSKDIVIVDHGAAFDSESASPVLVHELIHALQDREVDLTQFENTFAKSDDSSLATRSMFEGEARMHETRYYASILGLDPAEIDWMRRFETSLGLDETYLLMQPSPYTATSTRFPYEWGARYVYYRWVQGGMSGVHDLYVAPPVTTRVLMASVDMDVAPEPEPMRPTRPAGPAGWTAVDDGVLGAWGLFLALSEAAPGGSVAEAQSLALAWRADSIAIYEGTSAGAGTAFAWRIDVGDPTLAATAASRLASLPGITTRAVGTMVVLAHASDAQSLDWAFAP